MAEPHAFVEPGNSVTVDLGDVLAAGFEGDATFEVAGASLGSASVDGSKLVYAAGEAGVERLQVDIVDGDGTAWTRQFGVAVYAGAGDA